MAHSNRNPRRFRHVFRTLLGAGVSTRSARPLTGRTPDANPKHP